MSISKRLAAHRASASLAAAEPDKPEIPNQDLPGEDEDNDESELTPKKEKPMSTDTDLGGAVAAARDEGVKAERTRASAVFASEHYAGREASAAKLLGKDMSAADIIDVLADMPKAASAATLTEEQQLAAAEEGGRKEMQDALAKGANSGIEANGGDGGKPDTRAASDSVWTKAYGLENGVK